MRSLSLLVILFLSSFIVFSQKTENDKFQNYSIDKVTLTLPSDWELNESGVMGTKMVVFSQLESDEDKFRENVNLMIQDLSGYNLDLQSYAKLSEDQVKQMITNSKMIESKKITVNGEQMYKLLYDGDQGVFHLRFEQYFCIKNNHAYLLTFTCEQDKYNLFKEAGEKILNSLKVK